MTISILKCLSKNFKKDSIKFKKQELEQDIINQSVRIDLNNHFATAHLTLLLDLKLKPLTINAIKSEEY